jgi:hypothetical protein
MFLTSDTLEGNSFIWTDLLRWWFKLTRLNAYGIQLNGAYREWRFEHTSDRLRAISEISGKLKTFSDAKRKNLMIQMEKELNVKLDALPKNWSLDAAEIKKMEREQITFGGHTQSHPILSRLSVEEAQFEIIESKQKLERIFQEPIRHFAYPNGKPGDFNETHERLIAEAGFDSACSTILGLNDAQTDRYALRRTYAMEEPMAVFACRLAGIGS